MFGMTVLGGRDRRAHRAMHAVFAVLSIVFGLGLSLLIGTAALAETQPGGSDRRPTARPADIPSNSLPYTYIPSTPPGPPTITSISPSSGPASGGVTVTITGANFTGATQVMFGPNPAASFVVNSPTQITAVTPAHVCVAAPEPCSSPVSVTTPAGTSNSVAYKPYLPPVIHSLTPPFGPPAGGSTVIITGRNLEFVTAVTVGSTPVTSFTVDSDTQITAVFPAGAPGSAGVVATSPAGSSGSVPYTYLGPPTITSLNPNMGDVEGGTTVVITGTNFTGATSVMFGSNPATTFTVNSPTQITAVTPILFCIASPDPCEVQVSVTTPLGTSNTVTYQYLVDPIIGSITPSSGPTAGGNTVTINGFGLEFATAVTFGSAPATSFTVLSDMQITAVVPPGAPGGVAVTVTSPVGVSNPQLYIYVPAPSITGLNPTSGPDAGGTSVTITGTNLVTATAVSFGATPAASFTINSPTQITATAPAGTGTVGVTVTGPGGVSSPSNYTYLPLPVITSVTPAQGPELGGTTVIIAGQNFTGTTSVTFGASPAAVFNPDSATQITATTPPGVGIVDVTVTTPAGSDTETNGFEYVDPCGCANDTSDSALAFIPDASAEVAAPDASTDVAARLPLEPMTGGFDVQTGDSLPAYSLPTYSVADAPLAAPALTSLSPNEGPESGGNTVTINGSGFTGVTAVRFGATPAITFTVVSDSQITAVAPPGTGTVQVTVLNNTALTYAVNNASAAEGNSGATTLTFTVTLSAASGQSSTVQYSTGGGTALGGASCGSDVDYLTTSGTLTFAPGETSKQVPVTVCAEATAEADETFQLTLSNPTGGATIATGTGVGTIGDDDTQQSVRVDKPTITPNGDGTANANFPITRGGASTGASASGGVGARSFLTVTVNYHTTDGTGTAGNAYIPTSGTLTFGPGETSKTVDVTILPAGLVNPDNTFNLVLTGPSNAVIPPGGGQAQALVGESTAPLPQVYDPGTDDDDKPRKETEEQRQQRERTNRSNKDDVYTEGNVIEVHQDASQPYVVIVNRDGPVKVLLECGSKCPKIEVGQYLEADGVKEHEALFYAETVTVKKR